MKSLAKALNILELFLTSQNEMSSTNISKLSGINKSTVCRISSKLVERGYLKQREKRGKYSLGTIFLEYSGVIKNRLRLRSIAVPYLIKLSQHLNESVMIAVWDKKDGVLTETFHETAYSNSPLRVIPDEGIAMPLHNSCLGKIILADFSEEELQSYFNSKRLERHTPNTITNINEMRNHLKSVRKKGIAFDDEEYSLGVRGVAAGLRDNEGKISGSIGVIAPSVRLTRAKMRELLPDVKGCAMEISRELGFKD